MLAPGHSSATSSLRPPPATHQHRSPRHPTGRCPAHRTPRSRPNLDSSSHNIHTAWTAVAAAATRAHPLAPRWARWVKELFLDMTTQTEPRHMDGSRSPIVALPQPTTFWTRTICGCGSPPEKIRRLDERRGASRPAAKHTLAEHGRHSQQPALPSTHQLHQLTARMYCQ